MITKRRNPVEKFLKRATLAGGLILAGTGTVLAQQKGAPTVTAPQPAQIDRNGVLILIRTTLLALQQANETGNYTVLRDLAAPGFREANDAARLAEIFANLRAQKLDLSGVAVLDPQLTLLPQIEANGLLHMSGFFPSVPSQVNFELLFAPVEGRWRPFGLAVNVGSSTPMAPAAPVQQPAAPQSSSAATADAKRSEPKKALSKPIAPQGKPVPEKSAEPPPGQP